LPRRAVTRRGWRLGGRGSRFDEEPIMTQAQLEDAVAAATGEPAYLIRGMGFSLVPCVLEPEDLDLCVACPFCGQGVTYPGSTYDGSTALAECLRCDVYFDVSCDEVYAAGPTRLAS
jgi:hypothetical protein